jgi:two-component system, OmpR family, sensor histidine kinase KdpD
LREHGVVLQKRSPWSGLVAALLSVAVITGLIYPLREVVPVVSTGVVYTLAVLLVSSYWGLWLGLLTALMSSLAWNFFHIPPTGGFTIADGEHWVALAVFFVAAVAISALADAARARAEEAETRRREADLAAEMARELLGATVLDESLRVVARQIATTFGLASVGIELAWTDSDERHRAVPLLVEGSRIGTVMLPRDTEPSVLEALEDRVIPTLETLVAAARKREELEAQVIETKALRRSNVVKTAVLRSVSHDLRSPLTAITTAAAGLTSPTLSPDARAELVSVIETESARLSRLVDNLLDLSKLQAGAVEPHADWCPIDELVRAAIDTVPRPPGGFDVEIDAGLPLLRVDAGQLERAIANVLDNATRYAESQPVTIRARAAPKQILLRIGDRGPGIAREELERVFEPFHLVEEGAGTGLGLAIARGFVEANGGRIRADSLPGQGTTIVISLPVAAEQPAEALPVSDEAG